MLKFEEDFILRDYKYKKGILQLGTYGLWSIITENNCFLLDKNKKPGYRLTFCNKRKTEKPEQRSRQIHTDKVVQRPEMT